jgi:hypothetical protein
MLLAQVDFLSVTFQEKKMSVMLLNEGYLKYGFISPGNYNENAHR